MGSVSLHKTYQGDGTTPAESEASTVQLRRFRVTEQARGDLLSVTEFADEARITRQAVLKMIAENRLQANKIGEQHVISQDELDRYLADR